MAETTGTLSNNLHSFYQKKLLESAEKTLKFKQFADEKVHPRGNGKDYFLLRYGNVLSSTNELTEAVTPTATTVDTNKYTVTIKEYGQYIAVSSLLKLTAIDPVIESISERMGYAAAKSMDEVIRNDLTTNATNIKYVGTGNSADNDISANETFVSADALKAVATLRGQDAMELNDGMYAWIVHPYVSIDMMSDTSAGGFIELNKYVAGLAEGPLKGEIGKAYGTRIVESSNITSALNGSSVPVYRTFVIAKNAYCITKFNEDAVEVIVKQAGSAGTSDPLNQISTVGYKMQFGTKYLGGDFSNANGASPDLVVQLRGAVSTS
jgi:N4-gp56 family major capsid protein